MLVAPRSLISEKVLHGNVERPRSVPLVVLSLFLNFFFAAGILKPRGVLLFALLLLCGSTPPRGSWDLGGKVLVGFLGCADCDVLKSSGVTCCARAAAAVAVTRPQRICMRCISSCGGTQ